MGRFSDVLNAVRVVGESDLSPLGVVTLLLVNAGQWYDMAGTFEDGENKNITLNAVNGELTFTGSRNAVNTSLSIFRMYADKVSIIDIGTSISDTVVGFNSLEMAPNKEQSITDGNITESSPNVRVRSQFRSDTANTLITFKIYKTLINGFLEPIT